MLGIGIDTGGTCTDAVLYDFSTKEILASGKALTTKENLETGIANALDTLPPDLTAKAELIALSTTLATNACLENKGARAKLLLLGFDWEMIDHLKDIYASYGLKDLTRFVVLDAKVEGIYANPFDPDWEDLRKKVPEYFEDCDSVGIVQKHPRANGGRFELTALQILKEQLQVPVTISYDISNEVDILKTCAGTMLNARLIPLINEFMAAVHRVMEKRGLHIPVSIVRSDGTMMTEDMARLYPVETILCGPAASVVGGSELAGTESGLIVDMGGTTTDIAIIRNRKPVLAKDGIRIGQWRTMVQGLYVETFGLGGDSAVRYKDEHLFLDTVRVIPLSVLSSEYPSVLPKLQRLAEAPTVNSSWIHEFYVLQKDISGKKGYTDYEQKVCQTLEKEPLMTLELAERMGCNARFLSTERLEEEGVIMRSGLTPTDMMILKGDFTLYDGAAAEAAVKSLMANIREPVSEVPDLVYEMVCGRMYRHIARIILRQQYPDRKEFFESGYLMAVLECCYQQAKEDLDGPAGKKTGDAVLSLSTQFPLIGVGAPIHVFLPRVAQLLHTKAIIPSCAGVANAMGAAASRKAARFEVIVKAEYSAGISIGYTVVEDGKRLHFEELEEAVAFGEEVLHRAVARWASLQELSRVPETGVDRYENRFGHKKDGILFEVILSASVQE